MVTAAAEYLFPEAAHGLAVEAGPAGLVLGRDAAGDLVRVRLFRPEPTRVTFVGGGWAARLLVFRLLALGARVAVRATEPYRWTALDETAGGVGDRVWPVQGDQVLDLPADDTSPVLHLYDVGTGAAPERTLLGPWHTQLTVLARLTSTVSRPVAESDLVLLQRLSEPEAALAAAVMGLGGETASLLQAMRDDMVAVAGGRADRYVWFTPTSVEQRLFGAPQR
jgi:hypothetical protein